MITDKWPRLLTSHKRIPGRLGAGGSGRGSADRAEGAPRGWPEASGATARELPPVSQRDCQRRACSCVPAGPEPTWLSPGMQSEGVRPAWGKNCPGQLP